MKSIPIEKSQREEQVGDVGIAADPLLGVLHGDGQGDGGGDGAEGNDSHVEHLGSKSERAQLEMAQKQGALPEDNDFAIGSAAGSLAPNIENGKPTDRFTGRRDDSG